MSQLELAEISKVSLPSIQRFESDDETILSANQKTIKKLKNALEQRGIRFGYKEENDKLESISVKYLPLEDKNTLSDANI